MAVSMNPGQIALTRMPRWESSALSDSLRPTTACLEVAYGAVSGPGTRPSIDAVLTMWAGRPCSSIRGTNACTPWITPMRFTPSTRRHSSRLVSSTRPACPTPALLCRMSTAPSASQTRSASASTADASVTSSAWETALPPLASISRATAAAPSSSRSATCTAAPRRANSSAVERPMPDAAPVTTAIRPWKSGGDMRGHRTACEPLWRPLPDARPRLRLRSGGRAVGLIEGERVLT